MRWMLGHTRWALTLITAVWWLIMPPLKDVAHAQALRPYEPPSTRPRIYQQQQTPQQQAPPLENPATSEGIYERFRRDVQKMPPGDREKLADRFRQALLRARSDGRDEEVIHYERLLGILESVR